MKFVTAEDIPFTTVWKVLVVVDRVFELIVDAVLVTPFTTLVIVFTEEEREFVVVGRSPTIEVVLVTPFTLDVTIPPE